MKFLRVLKDWTERKRFEIMACKASIKLLFFAKARDLAEKDEMVVEVPKTIKCHDLRRLIFNEVAVWNSSIV